jgi:hypothetical protein
MHAPRKYYDRIILKTTNTQCCCDPSLGLHKLHRGFYTLNFHQILKIFWVIVNYVYEFWLVFLKMGFLTKKYRNNFFWDLVPKICAQNVHKGAHSVKKLSSGSETVHKTLCNKNIRNPHLKKCLGPPLPPALCYL